MVILATGNAAHQLEASPRGGDPGFVRVTDDGVLLMPWPAATPQTSEA